MKKLAGLLVLLGVTSSAYAGGGIKPPPPLCKTLPCPSPVAAPEIDPTSAMTALTLVMGGLTVVRGRGRK